MVALILLLLATAAPATPVAPQGAQAPTRPAAQKKQATHSRAAVDLPPLRCFGTEPFWELTLEGSGLHFTDGYRTVQVVPGRPFKPGNRTEPWIWRLRAGKRPVEVVVHQRSCTDGMSEKDFDFEILFITGESAYEGCCERFPEPEDE